MTDFVFDQGPNKGKTPAEVSDDYLLQIQSRLARVPEGHEFYPVLVAVEEELANRGKLVAAPQANNEVFRVPAPIPASEARRKAALATRNAVIAAEAGEPAESVVGPPAASRIANGHSKALMPCGHPTTDLEPVDGSWKGRCKGCERLERIVGALAVSNDPREALLDFEAEIRGYKPV